ncbi:MAG: hypothetical protein RIG62_14735 [Cyclobacteriaceae bacterium]
MKTGIRYDSSRSDSLEFAMASEKEEFTFRKHKILFIGQQSAKLQLNLVHYFIESEPENLIAAQDIAEAFTKLSEHAVDARDLKGIVCDADYSHEEIRAILNNFFTVHFFERISHNLSHTKFFDQSGNLTLFSLL